MPKFTPFVANIPNLEKSFLSNMDKGLYNYCIAFSTCEMRLLNQMLNLSQISDCFSRRFDKVVFNSKLSNLVDSDGKCENRRLSWVMIIVSSITKNTTGSRYAMIDAAFFILL